jgi:hypothetical protein
MRSGLTGRRDERLSPLTKRPFEAMMPMKKIDIATIEAARRG